MKNGDFLTIIIAIVALTAMGVGTVVLMGAYSNTFDKSYVPFVLGLIAPTIVSLLALLKSMQNGGAIQDLHLIVNSRLTELLAKSELNATLVERAANASQAYPKEIAADGAPIKPQGQQ
jgi:hypothetical protein